MYSKIRKKNTLKRIRINLLLLAVFCLIFQGQITYAATPNKPPVVVSSERIQKQIVTIGQPNTVIDLSKLFYDADGDALTYQAVPVAVGIVSTKINSKQLSIETLAPGTTRIKITADDGKLGRASSSFEIEVQPKSNTSPTVNKTIDNQTATVGDADITIDVSDTFTDVDLDTLTITASSSDESVATVSADTSSIAITPKAAGTSTITVQADDGQGGTVSTSFEIEVQPKPNTAPVVNKTIDNQTATVGGADISIDVSDTFTDVDLDTLTITASSSDESVATVSADTSSIAITPKAAGTSTITVQADDGQGGTVSTSFTVTIKNASTNHDPEVSKTIPNQRATVGGIDWNSWSIDINGIFTDADNDTLSLTAVSSNTDVASINLIGNTISISAKTTGSTVITVTADDGNGGTVSTTFSVTIDTPSIFISDYVQGPGNRNFLEIYNATATDILDYDIKIYQYNAQSNTTTSGTDNILLLNPGMIYRVIDVNFLDFFDITSASYYNTEYDFTPSDTVVIAIELLDSNGQVIDVLGDKTAKTSILPNNGGYVRDKRLRSGSATFNINEWNKLDSGDYTSVGY